MCYARMIRPDLAVWQREFGASLDIAAFQNLFSERVNARC